MYFASVPHPRAEDFHCRNQSHTGVFCHHPAAHEWSFWHIYFYYSGSAGITFKLECVIIEPDWGKKRNWNYHSGNKYASALQTISIMPALIRIFTSFYAVRLSHCFMSLGFGFLAWNFMAFSLYSANADTPGMGVHSWPWWTSAIQLFRLVS